MKVEAIHVDGVWLLRRVYGNLRGYVCVPSSGKSSYDANVEKAKR